MYLGIIKLFKASNYLDVMNYEELLNETYEKIKPISVSERFERWEVPEASVHLNGSKTIICNFAQICSYIRRDCCHLAKFLSKELASQSKFEGDRLVLNRKISPTQIENKISLYVQKFVVCDECEKPDTELVKENGFLFIHCLACGAKHSLGRG